MILEDINILDHSLIVFKKLKRLFKKKLYIKISVVKWSFETLEIHC